VLRKATARRPADRFRDATAFAAALDQATAWGGRTARRRSAMAAGAALAAVALLAAMAADSVRVRSPGGPGTGQDSTRRITVTLPQGWRVGGSGWSGQRDARGRLEPALVMSPDPDRWPHDPAVPGAFVGLSRGIAARYGPARYLAEHPHAECTATPLRVSRQAGVAWVVAEFTSCREGKPVLVEAAGVGPDGAGLAYVQIAAPAGAGSGFVDTLLAGVRVRP